MAAKSSFCCAARLRRRGVQRVVQAPTGAHDVTLVDGMARAFYWQHLIDIGQLPSGSDVARAEGVHHSVVNELLRLTLLPKFDTFAALWPPLKLANPLPDKHLQDSAG